MLADLREEHSWVASALGVFNPVTSNAITQLSSAFELFQEDVVYHPLPQNELHLLQQLREEVGSQRWREAETNPAELQETTPFTAVAADVVDRLSLPLLPRPPQPPALTIHPKRIVQRQGEVS